MGRLPEHQQFIRRFLRDARSLLKCQKVLKTKGLSAGTYNECKNLLQDIPQRSQIYIGFITWMEKQLIVAQSLGVSSIGMPICSDILESLYGVGKTHGTGKVKDANRIALRLPAYCGDLSDDAAKMVMGVSTKQQQDIEKELFSLTRQRRKILSNPGTITDLLSTEGNQYLSLFPTPKAGEKMNNIINITTGYENSSGSRFCSPKDLIETYRVNFGIASDSQEQSARA